jgi:hypothetical protein
MSTSGEPLRCGLMARDGSIGVADRDLIQRVSIALLFLFVVTAAFAQLHLVYSQKFHEVTGEAKWIWARHRMSDDLPLAFFAARDIDLPERRRYAHLKVLGDPEYTLYVNGREIAGRRIPPEDRQIDFYDISELVKTGRNRIVIAVRARQGVGGLIAALDIGPETENWIVTDDSWRIYRRWNPEILVRDSATLGWETPVIVGEPPIGRWNFLSMQKRELAAPPATVIAAKESFAMKALLPRIRTRSGIAVAVAEQQRARAFDFGPTSGRIRITVDRDPPFGSRAIIVRTANHREELGAIDWNTRAVVFAPGERTVVTPEMHLFRYVLVYGVGASADVIR